MTPDETLLVIEAHHEGKNEHLETLDKMLAHYTHLQMVAPRLRKIPPEEKLRYLKARGDEPEVSKQGDQPSLSDKVVDLQDNRERLKDILRERNLKAQENL